MKSGKPPIYDHSLYSELCHRHWFTHEREAPLLSEVLVGVSSSPRPLCLLLNHQSRRCILIFVVIRL